MMVGCNIHFCSDFFCSYKIDNKHHCKQSHFDYVSFQQRRKLKHALNSQTVENIPNFNRFEESSIESKKNVFPLKNY